MNRRFLRGLGLCALLLSCGVPEDDTQQQPELGQVAQPLGFSSYDSALQVQSCPFTTEGCATYDDVKGSGYQEYHNPNTLHSACADGLNSAPNTDDQIEYLRIEPADGSTFFVRGKTVRFTATAWVTGWGMGYDKIELYHTADVNNPKWVLLKTVTPNTTNLVDAIATFVLPAGERQAVRARMRRNGMGTAGPCGTSGYDDHDDLAFSVDQGDLTPPTVSVTKPAQGEGVQGAYVILEANSSDVGGSVTKVEFYVGSTLVATDTTMPAPLASVSWDARTFTPGNYTLTAKAYDSNGNVGTSAPASFTITPDVTPPTVSLYSPASGATLSSAVTFGADAFDDFGISKVEFYVGDTLVATRDSPKWDSTTLPNGGYTVVAKAYDLSGNIGSSTPTTMTVSNAPSIASYDATVKAPFCATVRGACDTGTLLVGRATLNSVQTAEFHQPNTVDGCQDGSSGTYHQDESIEQLKVSTLDGTDLAAGKTVRVDVKAWARSSYWVDSVDIYSAADASAPVWRLIKTVTPSAAGEQWLAPVQFTLPAGSRQVVRAHIRYGDGPAACSTTRIYDDHDDVVFAAAEGTPDTTPPSVTITSPTAGSTVSGTVQLQANVTDNGMVDQVSFYDGPYLLGTDTTPPYSASWNTSTSYPGSRVLTVKARDGAGNETTSQISVLIPDNTPPTTSITSPTANSTVRGLIGVGLTATDAGGVSKFELYVDGVLTGTAPYYTSPLPTTWNTSVNWNTLQATDGSHTLTTKAYDASGNVTTSAAVVVTVNNVGMARYDATLMAPACATVSDRCESGYLLNGRGTQGPEQNAPNTLQGSCPDSNWGGYYANGSNESLIVRTLDGTPLEEGKQVRVEARVYASNTAGSEKLELYSAPSASSPVWTLVATVTPTATNIQVLTATYTLPTGTQQALRARYYFGNTAGLSCGGSAVYDDHDDLVFAVQKATPDTTPPTVSISSPVNGGTVGGTVTINASASDNRLVSRVEFYVDGALLGTDTSSPYSVSWNTAGLLGSHILTAKAYDGASNEATSSEVSVTVSDAPINTTASYDATLRVPLCSGRFNRCDSGTLLNGRGNLGPEPNKPNTLQGTCADGNSGSYHGDESSDAITLSTVDGTAIAPGKTVRIDVKVWAYSSYTSDKLDLYYTANANSPSWTYLTTLTPTGSGVRTLSATYTLPTGTLQAVRARFRYGGSAAPCGTGAYDDHDDLAFAVGQ